MIDILNLKRTVTTVVVVELCSWGKLFHIASATKMLHTKGSPTEGMITGPTHSECGWQYYCNLLFSSQPEQPILISTLLPYLEVLFNN